MKKAKTCLIQGWSIRLIDEKYYLPYTHWIYLDFIENYFDKVILIAPVVIVDEEDVSRMTMKELHENVCVVQLPAQPRYIDSIRYFRDFVCAYKSVSSVDIVYARYPTPFGWLQKIYLGNAKRIIHFVGDPIDAAINNPTFTWLQKAVLVAAFYPEHLMYMWACHGARVFTNGKHLADRLRKFCVVAEPLVSSTLVDDDYYFDKDKKLCPDSVKILYVGYLRKAKGVEVVLKAFKLVQDVYGSTQFTVVGAGEYESDLRRMAGELGLTHVHFRGHVESRETLNGLYREHDFFCFGSLSEGSPRVILEAMANGLNVISTPVGSLPDTFRDRCEILFAEFNNPVSFFERITELIHDRELAESIRRNAFERVNDYRLSNFIARIFNDG